MITTFLSFLPASLAPYSSLISLLLVFVDGLIFGFAAKKALVSAILIIVGIILAGLLGISLPSHLTANEVVSKLVSILVFQATHSGSLGGIFYTLPIFFIIGFAVGIWKG